MARDRNRSKQRRARRSGAGRPTDGSTDARAREIGLDSDAPQDSLPAAEKASPYVDEARMAEAGADVPGDDPEPGSDNIATDPAVLEERRPPRRKRGRVLTFLGHVVDELRRVQWPDRRQTGQGTAVTLGFVVIAGGFLGLMDAIWQPLIEAIL